MGVDFHNVLEGAKATGFILAIKTIENVTGQRGIKRKREDKSMREREREREREGGRERTRERRGHR